MGQQGSRTARLEARLAPETLEIVKRAAEIEGRSVSDFVVTAAQEAARQTIEGAHLIRLSLNDQRAFVDAILNPPAPNDAMRRAASARRALVADAQ